MKSTGRRASVQGWLRCQGRKGRQVTDGYTEKTQSHSKRAKFSVLRNGQHVLNAQRHRSQAFIAWAWDCYGHLHGRLMLACMMAVLIVGEQVQVVESVLLTPTR